MQAVRGVLAGEEHAVARPLVARAMHLARRYVKHAARPRLEPGTAFELHLELAFENEDPLLVGVRMRSGRLPGRIAHQRDDHALALDAAAEYRRICRSAHNLVHLMHIEEILAGTGALCAGRAGLRGFNRGWICTHGLFLLPGHTQMTVRRVAYSAFRRNVRFWRRRQRLGAEIP